MSLDVNGKIIRGDEHKKAGFFAHFPSLDHNRFLEDTQITFIDKIGLSNQTGPEDFWIATLKTRYPLGLHNYRFVPLVDIFAFLQVTTSFFL